MKSMKHLLRLVGALALSTGAATSVVACGNPDSNVILDKKVSDDLGLTSDGKGNQEVKFSDDFKSWSIPVATPAGEVTAATLLNSENKAKSEDSYNFLTQVLNAKADDDKKFKKDELENIKVVINAIAPTLSPNDDKTDFVASSGTFKLQFKKDETNLGANYTLPLATKFVNVTVNNAIKVVTDGLAVANTDAQESALKFKVGEKPGAIKGTVVNFKDDFKTKMDKLNNLTGKTIVAKVKEGSATGAEGKWQAQDKITIEYCADGVTFANTTVLTLS